MKTFAISLERTKERRKYIQSHLTDRNLDFEIVNAIDGQLLTNIDLEKFCDMKAVTWNRYWISNGVIGCAISHKNVYDKIVKQNLRAAVVVEDDVILPDNILQILAAVEKEIAEDEIILLYYASFTPCALSKSEMKKTSIGSLVFPVNLSQVLTTTAYVIGNKAAREMAIKLMPIRTSADNWDFFYKARAFNSLRVLFPNPIQTKIYKSSIDYHSGKSVRSLISDSIDRFRIPVLYQLTKYLRKRKVDKTLKHFFLSDETPFIYK